MEIGEFSRQCGISIDTLRYYNKIGLLVPERGNYRRNYEEEDLEKAAVIVKLKKMNFSLEEIKTLFELEKEIGEDKLLTDGDKENINACLNIIKRKYEFILQQEMELIQIKKIMEKMIMKTNKLLETGVLFDKNKE